MSSDILSVKIYLAAVWFHGTSNKVEECAFTSTIRAYDATQFALKERQGQVIDCGQASESLP